MTNFKVKIIRNFIDYGVLIGVFVLILSNFITKYILFINPFTVVYPSTVVKFFFILIALSLYINKHLKSKNSIIIAILFFLLLMNVLWDYQLLTKQLLVENIHYFLKHLFLFLFFPIVCSLNKDNLERVINWLIIFGLANVVLMWFGFLFEINLFKSYPNSRRFGYNGVLPIQGVGTFFYAFLITISLLRTYQKKFEKKSFICFFILIIGTLLLGTKASYLFVTFSLIAFLFMIIKNRWWTVSILLAACVSVVVFFKKIVIKMVDFQNIGREIYEEKGVLTFLMSKRDLLLKSALNHIEENWTLVNHFVGSLNFKMIRVELELIDIYMFFGAFGVIVYTWFIVNFLHKKNQMVYNYFLYLILFISFLTGNLFSSITNVIFFVLTIVYLQRLKLER